MSITTTIRTIKSNLDTRFRLMALCLALITAMAIVPSADSRTQNKTDRHINSNVAKYFSPAVADKFNRMLALFTTAKTDADFAKAYANAKIVIPVLNQELSNKLDDLNNQSREQNQRKISMDDVVKEFDGIFGFELGYGVNDIRPEFFIKTNELKALAAKTTGNLDDQFMAYRQIVYGSSDLHNAEPIDERPIDYSFVCRTEICDGSTNECLGDNKIFNFLKKSQEFRNNALFSADIERFRSAAIPSISEQYSNTYANSRKSVVEEIKRILQSNFLSGSERKQVEHVLKRIKSSSGLVKIYFDCGKQPNHCPAAY